MSRRGNKPLGISRGKDVLLVYLRAFKGTPSDTAAATAAQPSHATAEGDTARPAPRPTHPRLPRPAPPRRHLPATGGQGGPQQLQQPPPASRPSQPCTYRSASDELHRSRGHQWGNGLVPDQMLRALLQVDGVLSARDGCQVKRPPLLCCNQRCFCGTSLFSCTTQGSARLPLLIRLWLDQDVLLPLQHPQEHKGVQVGLRNCKQ